MVMKPLPERVQALEDEVQGLDSALDSRTRRLWVEVVAIKALVASLRDEIAQLNRSQAEQVAEGDPQESDREGDR